MSTSGSLAPRHPGARSIRCTGGPEPQRSAQTSPAEHAFCQRKNGSPMRAPFRPSSPWIRGQASHTANPEHHDRYPEASEKTRLQSFTQAAHSPTAAKDVFTNSACLSCGVRISTAFAADWTARLDGLPMPYTHLHTHTHMSCQISLMALSEPFIFSAISASILALKAATWLCHRDPWVKGGASLVEAWCPKSAILSHYPLVSNLGPTAGSMSSV